jgi:hypothetical protein
MENQPAEKSSSSGPRVRTPFAALTSTTNNISHAVGHMLDSTGLTYNAPSDDPYALRPADEMESERFKATRVWRVRLAVLLTLQLATIVLLILQRYFYSTAVTGVMWIAGVVGVFWSSTDAIFLYLVLIVINFGKDIGVAWVFLDTKYAIATIATDMALLSPFAFYCAFCTSMRVDHTCRCAMRLFRCTGTHAHTNNHATHFTLIHE